MSRCKSPIQKDVELDGYELLYSSDEVRQGISEMAVSILEVYSGSCFVNIVPVMTGAIQFAASLLMDLEGKCPGKWKVSPVFCSTYIADSVAGDTLVDFPSNFDSRTESGAPSLILDDIYDSGRNAGMGISIDIWVDELNERCVTG